MKLFLNHFLKKYKFKIFILFGIVIASGIFFDTTIYTYHTYTLESAVELCEEDRLNIHGTYGEPYTSYGIQYVIHGSPFLFSFLCTPPSETAYYSLEILNLNLTDTSGSIVYQSDYNSVIFDRAVPEDLHPNINPNLIWRKVVIFASEYEEKKLPNLPKEDLNISFTAKLTLGDGSIVTKEFLGKFSYKQKTSWRLDTIDGMLSV